MYVLITRKYKIRFIQLFQISVDLSSNCSMSIIFYIMKKECPRENTQLLFPEGFSHLHSCYIPISRSIALLYSFSISCVIFLLQEHRDYFASVFLALLHPCPIWDPQIHRFTDSQHFFYETFIPLILVL